MSCDTHKTDLRRFGQIEVRQHGPGLYRLTINGVLWASIEWSGSKAYWCVEDGCGRCLAHVEHIHGQDVNADSAIKLAKAMIRDGRMPTPEEALVAVEELEKQKAQERKAAMEAKVPITLQEPVLVPRRERPDNEE